METLSPPKLPLSWEERAEFPDVLRVAASLKEYWELVDELPYRIEYADGEIISIMGQASIPHEILVIWLGTLFNNLFSTFEPGTFNVVGSNAKIQPPDTRKSFNADLSVVRGQPDIYELPSGRVSKSILINPEIIVEVLSDSTRQFDQSTKLDAYKTILSLRHVLFVDQSTPEVRTFSRSDSPNEWINRDYFSLNELVRVGEFALPMRDIYRTLPA